MAAIDYLHARADRRIQLHIHAQVTTDDGENLAFFADGVAVVEPGASVAPLHENGSFVIASPRYAWLNQVQVWGQGTVDLVKRNRLGFHLGGSKSVSGYRTRHTTLDHTPLSTR